MVDSLTNYVFRRPVDLEIALIGHLRHARAPQPGARYFQPADTTRRQAQQRWEALSPRYNYERLINAHRTRTEIFTRPVPLPGAGSNDPWFPPVPEFMPNDREHRRQLARAINGLRQAKVNAHIDVTLTPNATTTVITDSRIGEISAIFPAMAQTANGATAIAAGMWISNQVSGSCTVNHANSANADQTIRFLIVG